jgi:hypothetical protein
MERRKPDVSAEETPSTMALVLGVVGGQGYAA